MKTLNKRLTVIALLTLVLTMVLALPVMAAPSHEICYSFGGTSHCLFVPKLLEIQPDLPDPGPHHQVAEIANVAVAFEQVLQENPETMQWINNFLEPDPTPWILTSTTGEHVVMLDMAQQTIVVVQAPDMANPPEPDRQ